MNEFKFTRIKANRLKNLLIEGITLIDFLHEENKRLRIKLASYRNVINELSGMCADFAESELNLHKKIEKLKDKSKGKVVVINLENLFDRPDCPYLLKNGECNFDYIPCNQKDKDNCSIYRDLKAANKRFEKHMEDSRKLAADLKRNGINVDLNNETGEISIDMGSLKKQFERKEING